MMKKLLIFAIIFSLLALSSCDAKPGETPTDPTNEESTVLSEMPSDEESTKDDEDENTVSENVTEESEEPTEDAKNTAYPTEPASDMPKDETAVENVEIPELNADRLPFTIEFTDTAYTTKSDRINFHIKAKQPGDLGRGDQWKLYKIDGDKVTLAGAIMWDIAIDYEAKSEDEYIERDDFVSIKTLCGKETLDAGQYCLIFYIQIPDENGYYHSASGATLYFEVKQGTETESESDMPTDETAVEKVEIPELNADNLEFTMELTETVYTTSSEKITYRIRSKEPAEYIVRGDQWKLYRIDGDKATLLGETMFSISVEIYAESGKEYVDREGMMPFKELYNEKTLEAGKYCLIYYHSSSSGIAMYFEVVE